VDRSGKAVANTGMRSGWERRSAPRARSRIEASYEDADRHVFLYTTDLSEDGVFLVSPTSASVGANATVLLELPGNPAILRLRGRVARQQSHPVAGFAVRFDPQANSGADRQALRDFVDSAGPGSAAPEPRPWRWRRGENTPPQ
jgi:hypothetical protein